MKAAVALDISHDYPTIQRYLETCQAGLFAIPQAENPLTHLLLFIHLAPLPSPTTDIPVSRPNFFFVISYLRPYLEKEHSPSIACDLG